MNHKEMLSNLRSQHWFQDFIEKVIREEMPEITPYMPGSQYAEWQYESGKREGYIWALKQFGVILSERSGK